MKIDLERLEKSPYILIEFKTQYSTGRIIMKEEYFLCKDKKIQKILKDTDFHIINPYHLTLDEFINFDEEFIRLNKYKKRLYSYLNYEKDHGRGEEYNYYLKRIAANDKDILSRLAELKKLYERGGKEHS